MSKLSELKAIAQDAEHIEYLGQAKECGMPVEFLNAFNKYQVLKLIELLEEAKEQILDYRNLLKHESYIFEEPESWLKSLEEFEK